MQVCDDETVLLRPTKNELLNTKRIIEQTGVHPTNMALARCDYRGYCQTISPESRGAGFATVGKRLNFLSDSRIIYD